MIGGLTNTPSTHPLLYNEEGVVRGKFLLLVLQFENCVHQIEIEQNVKNLHLQVSEVQIPIPLSAPSEISVAVISIFRTGGFS